MKDYRFPPLYDEPKKWEWKNLRCFSFNIGFWFSIHLEDWVALEFIRDDDEFGGRMTANLGPFELTFNYNTIRLMASDLDLSIEKRLEAPVYEEGEVVVSARLFSDIIRKLPNETIEEVS